jgi:hypothetical protein
MFYSRVQFQAVISRTLVAAFLIWPAASVGDFLKCGFTFRHEPEMPTVNAQGLLSQFQRTQQSYSSVI